MSMIRSMSTTPRGGHHDIIATAASSLRRVAARVGQWFDDVGGAGYCESEAERLLRSSGGRLTDAIERRLSDGPMSRGGLCGPRYDEWH